MTSPEAHHEAGRPGQGGRSPWLVRILMIVLVGVGAYYVIAEHGAHLLAAWPLLILLLCPLMHFFHGHGGHGGHGRRSDEDGGAGDRNA